MDRILAIIRLRVTLMSRQMQGKGGKLNLIGAILLLIIGVLFALGMAVGFGIMLYLVGRDGDPRKIRIGFLVVFYASLFFGLVLPLLRGAMDQEFDASPFVIFPLSRPRLYGLTLAATLGSTDHLLYIPSLFALAIGGVLLAGVDVLTGLALVLLAGLFYVTWGNLISLLVVSFMRGRRVKEITAIVGLALLLSLSLLPGLLDTDAEGIEIKGSTISAAVDTLAGLPPSLAADGLTALHRPDGRRQALASVVWLLVWDAAGVLLGYYVFSRFYLGQRRVGVSGRKRSAGPGKTTLRDLFSFDRRPLSYLPSEVVAVAAKDLLYILRSVAGRFNLFVVPVFVLIIIVVLEDHVQQPIMGMDPKNLLMFGMLFYALLFSNNFVNNAFAWENEGINSYFMSPVSPRAILCGKNLAVWIYNLALFGLLMGTWSIVMGPPVPLSLISATLVYTGALLMFTCFGNLLSVMFPLRRDISKINNSPSPIVVLASFLTLAFTTLAIAPFLIVPLMVGWDAMQPVFLLILVALASGAYLLTLGIAARMMVNRRERLIEALKSAR